MVSFEQFADITHFTSLFTSDWPAVEISEAATNDGNTGSAWNYGSNYGGPTKSTWTSGADSLTGGVLGNKTGQGMFGKFGVADTSYSADVGGQPNFLTPQVVSMCSGTAGAVCRG